MIDKRSAEDGVVVTFVLEESSHHAPIRLVGEFNDWDEAGAPLQPDGDGRLVASVRLPEGRAFQFRYRDALGRWFNDDAADDYCTNEWGGMNGVVRT